VNRSSFIICLITLASSPLLFGAVHTYAYTWMTLGVLAAFSLALAGSVRKDVKSGTYQLRFPMPGLNAFFVLLFLYLIFQMVPLPEYVLKAVSPRALQAGKASVPPSLLLPPDGAGGVWFAPAPYAYPVRMSAVRLAVYELFFLGFSRLLDSQRRIETALFVLLGVGCFEALYGVIQAYSGTGAIWWYDRGISREAVHGTCINRNHFAGLMGMGVLSAAAYAAGLSERWGGGARPAAAKRSFRARLSRFLSGEQRYNKRALVLFAGVVMGIGLIFSASRGGIVSMAAGLLCMSLFLLFNNGHRRKGIIFLALFSITAAYALEIGVSHVIERFRFMDQDYEARARLSQKTLDLVADYPVTGVGIGNFMYAYPTYQAVEDKEAFARHAHNDWVQFLAEGGIAGMALMLMGAGLYAYPTVRLWRRRKDPFAVCLGALPLAVLAAVGYAALHLERHSRHDVMNFRYVTLPTRYRGLAVLLMAFGLVVWSGYWSVRHFVAEAWCNTVTNVTLNLDPDPPAEEIRKAIAWDPWNAGYWYKLGKAEGRRLKAEGRRPTSDTCLPRRSSASAERSRDTCLASRLNRTGGERSSDLPRRSACGKAIRRCF